MSTGQDPTKRRRGFEALIARAEGNAAAMAALSRLLRTDGWKEAAADLAARALALAPHDAEVRAIATEILSADVPTWHFAIVRDTARNLAYEQALQRTVTPGCRVLEIGTGSGILSMMAVRAGAAHVYTCEMEPAVALAARDVIAKNGMAEHITVISKHSTAVEADEIGELADVFVSELISNDMLAESPLPVLEDAIARLVKPGAAIIPARGQVRVALAHDAHMDARRLGTISGFDLSVFNRVAPAFYQIGAGSPRLTLRSDVADLFDFGFETCGPWPAPRHQVEVRASGGPINGIAQWIAMDMGHGVRYENRPGPGAASSWAILFHPFAETHEFESGQSCRIFGHHDRAALRIW
jgi:predicted O-methyltransferase YrrM